MVEDVVGVGGVVLVADDAGVLGLPLFVHVATHREPGGTVVLLVLNLDTGIYIYTIVYIFGKNTKKNSLNNLLQK